MTPITKTQAFHGRNRYGRSFKGLDAKRQLIVLLDVCGHDHMIRDKTISNKTVKTRIQVMMLSLAQLREAGYAIKNMTNFDQRHVKTLLDRWIGENLAAATIQGRLSVLRWFTIAIGKPGLVRDPSFYDVDLAALARVYVATEDKSWSAKHIVSAEIVASAMEIDPAVGHQLDMSRAFGLRVRESILIKPKIADLGHSLRVEEGTKGGRTRVVLIRSDDQRETLERAKEFSSSCSKGTLIPVGRDFKQMYRRFYYVMEKLGISRAQLGVTAHGLRHEYANDLYETESGIASPVRGGLNNVDPDIDDKARHLVSQDLGHSRVRITASYTGARRTGRPPKSRTSPLDLDDESPQL
jgi:integrase